MNLIVAPEAEADLVEIYEYIASDRPRAVDALLNRLYIAFQRLADGELDGPTVRLTDGRRVQRWPVPPYRIYYERRRDQTVILRVYHGARRPIE